MDRPGDPLATRAGNDLLGALGQEAVARLRAAGHEVRIPSGTLLIAEGEPADAMYLVVEGELAVTKRAGSTDLPVATVGAGAVQGEMAVLEGGLRTASVRALTDARLVRVARDDLLALLAADAEMTAALLGAMARRLRSTETLLAEQDRLAALGRLAAGLAHELNNPAAALRSTAARLADAILELERAAAGLAAPAPGPGRGAGAPAVAAVPDDARDVSEVLDALREELVRRAAAPPALDPLEASDRADTVLALLQSLGVRDAAEPAAALVALGWDGNALDDLLAVFQGGERQLMVAQWLAAGAVTQQLVGEIAEAAARISEIVAAVKTYAYLDRARVQVVDVTEGLESTLRILRARMPAGATVRREFAAGLPRVEAYGAELNQVWTNLIDNAFDAMDEGGTLTLSARPDPASDGVIVEVTDDGPGIPADVRRRIFDPFYTTKDVGHGTGLGLYLARSIVARHGGRLDLASTGPQGTTFRVALPRQVPVDPGGEPGPA